MRIKLVEFTLIYFHRALCLTESHGFFSVNGVIFGGPIFPAVSTSVTRIHLEVLNQVDLIYPLNPGPWSMDFGVPSFCL